MDHVEVTISVPVPRHVSSELDYVSEALRIVALSYITANRKIESAALQGNWKFRVNTKPYAYQRSLWET